MRRKNTESCQVKLTIFLLLLAGAAVAQAEFCSDIAVVNRTSASFDVMPPFYSFFEACLVGYERRYADRLFTPGALCDLSVSLLGSTVANTGPDQVCFRELHRQCCNL